MWTVVHRSIMRHGCGADPHMRMKYLKLFLKNAVFHLCLFELESRCGAATSAMAGVP